VLYCMHGMSLKDVSVLLGPSTDSIKSWVALFNRTGSVLPVEGRTRENRWPRFVYDFIEAYVDDHPCFFIEELKQAVALQFPDLHNISTPTICRALRIDLNLTRKKLEKRARESQPLERADFKRRLSPWYYYPEQLVFLDETSKDGRSSLRRYAWSSKGTPAIVELPFSRGKRVSAIAAFSYTGFIGWEFTEGTFTRLSFHSAFVSKILPHLNPWPLPNSLLIIDNAKIHMYKELQDAVESRGAKIFFLPPYSPQLNPIEVAFGLVKKWIEKNANLSFHHNPEECLDLAFKSVGNGESFISINLYQHCGYEMGNLKDDLFS
jgi:transposase